LIFPCSIACRRSRESESGRQISSSCRNLEPANWLRRQSAEADPDELRMLNVSWAQRRSTLRFALRPNASNKRYYGMSTGCYKRGFPPLFSYVCTAGITALILPTTRCKDGIEVSSSILDSPSARTSASQQWQSACRTATIVFNVLVPGCPALALLALFETSTTIYRHGLPWRDPSTTRHWPHSRKQEAPTIGHCLSCLHPGSHKLSASLAPGPACRE
jgi:hypothetical protein